MSDVDEIRAAGWTQGSILLVSEDERFDGLKFGARYLVISHPCDVASTSLDRDPYVELLEVKEVYGIDGNLTFGKNPRRLQLNSLLGALEVDFTSRATADRRLLAGAVPELTLPEVDRRVLAAWLSARYSRPAFADEFNRRLSPATRGIQRVLKSAGSRVSAIYVATSLEELSSDENYQVHMAFTMLSEDFPEAAPFAEVSEGVDQIAELIRPLAGINLVSIDVYSEEAVTIDSLRTYARWDYDALSFKQGEDAALPVQA